jgi:hypothetical protein
VLLLTLMRTIFVPLPSDDVLHLLGPSENGSTTISFLSEIRTGKYFVGESHQIVRRHAC